MSDKRSCDACSKPMSATAARCPHCGALQSTHREVAARATTSAAPAREKKAPVLRDVSTDEARALLKVSDVAARRDLGGDDEPGLVEGMVLPHRLATGWRRVVEIALIAISLPLLVSSLLALGLMWFRAARFGGVRTSVTLLRAMAVLSGIGVLYSLAWGGRFEDEEVHVLVAVQLAALALRALVRASSEARRRAQYDLTR